jgi:DNA repair exonuclease SbcCD ATPase subunit
MIIILVIFMEIGFGSKNKSIKKDEDSLEVLERVVAEVEAETGQLSNNLKQEITNLEHLKENLKDIGTQVKGAEVTLKKRRKLVQELISLEMIPSFDVTVAEEILKKIEHYDKIINARLTLVGQEIRKYILTDIHEILSQNINRQSDIQRIDNTARNLMGVSIVIQNEMQAHTQKLQEIAKNISIRKNQEKVKIKRMGFK